MSIITLEQLKRKLRWPDITLEKRTHIHLEKAYHSYVFLVHPSNPSWPSVELWFDEDIVFLDPLGFSQWHSHYDRWSDERRNLVEALRTARSIVSGKRCLIEALDESGKCWGGCLAGHDEIPRTLGKQARLFRRTYFNRPPIEEPIDFTRYWEGKTQWVEWETKQDTETLFAENGWSLRSLQW